jgi:hypothetical protein
MGSPSLSGHEPLSLRALSSGLQASGARGHQRPEKHQEKNKGYVMCVVWTIAAGYALAALALMILLFLWDEK